MGFNQLLFIFELSLTESQVKSCAKRENLTPMEVPRTGRGKVGCWNMIKLRGEIDALYSILLSCGNSRHNMPNARLPASYVHGSAAF
jgi:hypothetical protein